VTTSDRHVERARALADVSDDVDIVGRLSPEDLDGVIEAVGTLAMQDVPAAIRSGRIIVRAADVCGTPVHRVRARRALSRALAWGSSYEAALASAREAVDLANAAALHEEAGPARLASMHALTEMGRLDDAASAGLAARQAFDELGLHAMAARADINLGVVYQHLDQPNEAVSCLMRAREPLAGEPGILGHLENNLGESLLTLDDVSGAEQAFLKARAAFEEAGAALTAAIAEGNLADLAARQGHLGEALRWFEGARRRLVDVDASGHLARLLAERAEAIASVGLWAFRRPHAAPSRTCSQSLMRRACRSKRPEPDVASARLRWRRAIHRVRQPCLLLRQRRTEISAIRRRELRLTLTGHALPFCRGGSTRPAVSYTPPWRCSLVDLFERWSAESSWQRRTWRRMLRPQDANLMPLSCLLAGLMFPQCSPEPCT